MSGFCDENGNENGGKGLGLMKGRKEGRKGEELTDAFLAFDVDSAHLFLPAAEGSRDL